VAKYPFLPKAKKYVAFLDVETLAENPVIRDRAKQKILASFELASHFSLEPSKRWEIEVASFPATILYVAGTGNGRLVERYALFEAVQIYQYLLEENDDVIFEIAEFFKWDIHKTEEGPYPYTIHFTNYLENAAKARLVHDLKWKLVNKFLNRGQVYLTKQQVCRLLQEEVKRHIENSAKQELMKIPETIQNDMDELKAKFLKMRPKLSEFDQIVRAEESEYPPCIRDFMRRAAKGQQLSHVERFTLVTYLLNQGVSVDNIVNLFSNVTDFKEDKTRYQVEHLAGHRGSRIAYKTYNCATLQTHGVCAKLDDPICKTIRNPLTYHLRKRWQKAPKARVRRPKPKRREK